ncbi:hypothetical protein SESBI_24237 [Sesbania bispinosa]|nr:hypothetical protein SESBI_24237 [Sesbania bispinosa]
MVGWLCAHVYMACVLPCVPRHSHGSKTNYRSKNEVAFFIFGGSFLDERNNNYINTTTLDQANFWPYGETYFKFPTGRLSDGWLHNGVNFSFGGAGALVETFQGSVETEHGLLDESVHAVEADPVPKTPLLETELAKQKKPITFMTFNLTGLQEFETLEGNSLSPSQGRNNQANGPVNSMAEGEVVTKERFEHTKSMLKAELRGIQERYFHMSLKYAEVESEREELVMKLKAAKNKKGWLS